MAYSDFPFPDDSPQFPNHSQMLDYFNAYAEHFTIRDRIQLNCRVESANPLERTLGSCESIDRASDWRAVHASRANRARPRLEPAK